MKIYFSRYAKRQMKSRKISESEVEETILNPEKIINSIKGRKNAFKYINERYLKVTFREENDKIVVITPIEKSKQEETI